MKITNSEELGNILKIELFEEWLLSKHPDENIAQACNSHKCPIAQYIIETVDDIQYVDVDEVGVSINKEHFKAWESNMISFYGNDPEHWFGRFVANLDSKFPLIGGSYRSVSPQDCLAVLEFIKNNPEEESYFDDDDLD